jgi:hypothetical protein
MSRLVADTHVHLYPGYDVAAALGALVANLARLAAPGDIPAAFLAERRDCQAFAALRDGTLKPAGEALEIRPLAAAGAVLVAAPGKPPVYLFAGRQVVAAERLEILALATRADIPDGLPAVRVIAETLAAGGAPVIGWSPGKWWGARGRLVLELLERFKPGELLLGDTLLRPALCPEPRLMREARRRGHAVLAGSDPLPLAGEEVFLGAYATVLQGAFDPGQPRESACHLLRDPAALTEIRGARGAWTAAARRWLRLARAPRAAA